MPQVLWECQMVQHNTARLVLQSNSKVFFLSGLSCNDKVSVFADLRGHCKRGWMQEFVGPKTFVGNGILTQTRKDIFNIENPK
jgi:hypothetical protein